MRLLKFGIICFVVFFAVITAISLLFPTHIRVSKAISLSRHADSVFYLINDFKQWPRWHPAFEGQKNIDSVLQKNSIRLTRIVRTDSLITMNWQQANKTPIVNSWQIHQFGTEDSVALQWYMDFDLKWYPWQKFGSLLYENSYGRLMELGLQNIKQIVQQKDSSHS